jgi:hypothetical protein
VSGLFFGAEATEGTFPMVTHVYLGAPLVPYGRNTLESGSAATRHLIPQILRPGRWSQIGALIIQAVMVDVVYPD